MSPAEWHSVTGGNPIELKTFFTKFIFQPNGKRFMKAKSVFTTSLQSWLLVVRQLFFITFNVILPPSFQDL